MSYHFSALFSRMNYIDRWGLMRNSRKETLSEHSAVVANIAYLLALLAQVRFGADVSPDRVCVAALYHDLSETLTGDMPTPVKYRDSQLRDNYKRIEAQAEQQLLGLLPEDIRSSVEGALTQDALNDRERQIVKAADKLSALVKCMEEESSGNREFRRALEATKASLEEMDLPELHYFMEEFLPAYSMNLDELMEQ